MKNRQFWYKPNTKTAIFLIQGLLAGLVVLLTLLVPVWLDGEVSLNEIGWGFENTDLFLETVEDIIREKIEYDINRELFEQGGSFNPDRPIDIRQYLTGVLDETSYNRNLVYKLSDLVEFSKEDAMQLQNELVSLQNEGRSDEEAAQLLMEKAASYETVLPVTGVMLADYVRMSGGSHAVLTELYRTLCDASFDIGDRSELYTMDLDDESRSAAPSNIAYYVENTATRAHYTNMGVSSFAAAAKAASENTALTWLFEGERRYNIMISNPEHVFSDRCSEWFMQTAFLGSEEQILIAYDPAYPIGDELRSSWQRYQQRIPILIRSAAAMLLLIGLLIALAVISFRTNGWTSPKGGYRLQPFDQIPTEIAVGICLAAAVTWWILGLRIARRQIYYPRREMVAYFVLCFGEYEILLFSLLSLMRRIHSRQIWKNSVTYYVVMGTRQVYSARKSSQRLLIIYVGFVVLNMLSLIVGGIPGLLAAFALNMAALLYLMRAVVGNRNIMEGLDQISQGKLDYRINTQALTGESREMGEAVNEMGEGLQTAVDSMIKSERFKAELITNVSHDLKTPLTSVINYVDLLKRLDLPEEKAREYIEVLDQKSQRLKQLTDLLIEASRISTGNVELHPDDLDVSQFVLQACGEFEERLESCGLTLVVEDRAREAGFGKTMIYVDGASLWRIFENLLENAAKYARKDTQVTVLVERDGEKVSVSFANISDRPITASAEQLKERFARGDVSRRTEGFGLGLSIADSLTQLMKGTFDVMVDETHFKAVLTFPVSGGGSGAAGTEGAGS